VDGKQVSVTDVGKTVSEILSSTEQN
jgi:hypothetical protein